ncbi:imm11 family protein [Archangium lansingense]|uniref:imm11 family protein n=1 Tax=Archangium lansingense TaxID=2995310 RepID=UPI003B7C0CF5
MNYFILNLMPLVDKSYCVLGDLPDNLLSFSNRLSRGRPMGNDYPKDPQWRMSDTYGGIKLPSLIANTDSILVVERPLKEVFEATGVAMECLPFVLVNHKGRVASRDYFIVNPLGNLDCLNLEKSEIEWLDDDVVGIEKFVLDTEKVKDAPDMFRVKEDRETIVISHRLADELKKVKPTNVFLFDVEQAPSSPRSAKPAKASKPAKAKAKG